jgi:hypothetical protein
LNPILVPRGRFAPAPGLVEVTTSFPSLWCLRAFGCFTFPIAQCAARNSRSAFASESPFSFGTTHRMLPPPFGGAPNDTNVALTASVSERVTAHAPDPVHAPPHADSLWSAEGVAVSATSVPGA